MTLAISVAGMVSHPHAPGLVPNHEGKEDHKVLNGNLLLWFDVGLSKPLLPVWGAVACARSTALSLGTRRHVSGIPSKA